MANAITLTNSGRLQVTIDNSTPASVAAARATELNDLTDVAVSGIQDSDRLVYDEATGKWVNEDKIDGGDFT